MTQRNNIQCVHEPFGDAFYYGPERLSERFENDEQARIDSGFSKSTFKTVLDRLDREASLGKRVFIKDIIHYLIPPNGQPASIAPSLQKVKRGVGTQEHANGDAAAADTTGVNGKAEGNGKENGVTNGSHAERSPRPSHAKIDSGVDLSAVPVGSNVKPSMATINEQGTKPYPYDTEAEPGNPTVMPTEIWSRFHFAFLIRDPHFSVPSYYRCTIPPLTEVTGFPNYDPSEAGYDEVRRIFEYLREVGLVGPQVATHDDDESANAEGLKPVVNGIGEGKESGAEICVVDADEMLQKPAPTIEAFCRSVGLDYDPGLLEWDTDEDHQFAKDAFEKWRGFHNDAIESRGLTAKNKKPAKSEEEFDAEWRERFGEEGAAIIRKTVDANMPDYLYLKQFSLRV